MIDRELQSFLLHYDPAADVDAVRVMRVQRCLTDRIDEAILSTALRPSVPRSFAALRGFAVSLVLMGLGVMTGYVLEAATYRATLQSQAEQEVSVWAMASPWDGWLAEGE